MSGDLTGLCLYINDYFESNFIYVSVVFMVAIFLFKVFKCTDARRTIKLVEMHNKELLPDFLPENLTTN